MINLTSRAIAQLERIRKSKNLSGNQLRISIREGGCLQYIYDIQFDSQINETDITLKHESEIVIITDSHISNTIKNLTIDYLEDLMGGAFQFKNPDIAHHCTCGLSFTLES